MAARLTPIRRRAVLAGGAMVAIIVIAPAFASPFLVMLLAQAFIYAIAAVSLDLVWGYAGIPEMGHSLWFGVGALAVGAMAAPATDGATADAGALVYIAAIAIGVVAATLLAAIVAWYAFSRGSTHFYIAVVGLALAAAAPPAYSQFPKFTGGEDGLFGFAYDGLSLAGWYWASDALMLVVAAGCLVVVRSDFGLLIRAIRDNESRTRFVGFDVERTKIAVYAGGAALAALSGAVFASMSGAVSAPLFGFLFATEMLVWVAVGGRGTIVGPLVGAIVIAVAGAKLSASFPTIWNLFIGCAFVLVVVLFPRGLLPPVADLLLGDAARRTDGLARALSVEPYSRAAPAGPGDVIEIDDLNCGYGGLRVLRGVSMSIRRGELICIVGPNGAGKSTLIGVLTDGERTFTGDVTFRLHETSALRGSPPDAIARRGIVRKFQVPSLFPTLTVAEHLLLAAACGRRLSLWRRSHNVAVTSAVQTILEATGLGDRLNEPASGLSHGLSQGLEIAMAVAARPQVIFMDEPTAGLTANEREIVGHILSALTKEALTVVLVEHDLDFVERVADRIAVLHDGRVLEIGPPADIVRSAIVRNAYLGSLEPAHGAGT